MLRLSETVGKAVEYVTDGKNIQCRKGHAAASFFNIKLILGVENERPWLASVTSVMPPFGSVTRGGRSKNFCYVCRNL